jgi:pimeloyl-ACP methyl ester carboxylesterase
MMSADLPLILVPGLLCSARLYAPQISALWPFGQVTVADHRRDDSMSAIATRILANAPPRFALAGLSMGGYIAITMLRLAPERVEKLALLDTSARSDTAEQSAAREKFIAMAQAGRLDEVVEALATRFLHRNREHDPALKSLLHDMASDTGADAFVRQQKAIMSRPDARPLLASIRCPTMVLVGDGDRLTPPDLSQEICTGIPQARLVVIPGCGHLSTVEQPIAVNAALAEWLGF